MNFSYYKAYSCWRGVGVGVQTTRPAYKVDNETDDDYYYDNDNDDDKQMIYRQNQNAV